jgi:N-acetylmuramic acid 6-phosphate etherase
MFEKVTESPSKYHHLEQMSVRELLQHINTEDHLVPQAVALAIPQIEALVESVVPKMQEGGRLFYIGAGTSGRLGILDASECPPTYGVPHDWVVGLIAGGDQAIRKAVENAEDSPTQAWLDLQAWNIDTLDTVVGIAASGTTPYVIHGMRACHRLHHLQSRGAGHSGSRFPDCGGCRTGVCHGQYTHEIRHGTKTHSKHDFHQYYDSTGACAGQSYGGHATE